MSHESTFNSTTALPPLPPLSPRIDTLAIFDHPTPVQFARIISNYAGERLYCKALLNEATLFIFIDDVGPATSRVPIVNVVNKAEVTITYQGQSTETASIVNFKYSGGFLHLTAALSSDESSLELTLRESPTALATPVGKVPAGYVIILDDNNLMQLRWIDEPVDLTKVPTSARVRPESPAGVGVSGPFGTETP